VYFSFGYDCLCAISQVLTNQDHPTSYNPCLKVSFLERTGYNGRRKCGSCTHVLEIEWLRIFSPFHVRFSRNEDDLLFPPEEALAESFALVDVSTLALANSDSFRNVWSVFSFEDNLRGVEVQSELAWPRLGLRPGVWFEGLLAGWEAQPSRAVEWLSWGSASEKLRCPAFTY